MLEELLQAVVLRIFTAVGSSYTDGSSAVHSVAELTFAKAAVVSVVSALTIY